MSTQNISVTEEQEEVQPVQKVAPFRIVTLIAFIVALGGLFIGLIPGLTSVVMYSASMNVPGLSGSLALLIYASIACWFPGATVLVDGTTSASPISFYFALAFVYIFTVCLLIALVAFIVCLCSRKAAKKCTSIVINSLFVGFTVLFVGMFVAAMLGGMGMLGFEGWQGFIDLPALIMFGAMLGFVIGLGVWQKKKVLIVNGILFLLSLAAVFGLFYPGGLLNLLLADICVNGLQAADAGLLSTQIALIALGVFAVSNCLTACSRMFSKKGAISFAVMLGVQFVLAIAALIMIITILYASVPEAWSILYALNSLILLIATLVAFVLAIVVAVVLRKAEYDNYYEDEEEYENEEAPAAAPAQTTVVTPAPYMGAPVVNYIMTAPPAEKVNSEEMSEFEKSMTALAKGEAPAQTAQPAPAPAPAYAPPAYMPGYVPAPVYPQSAMPATAPAYAFDTRFTYDPFFYTLTEAEKNEFGDLFIAGKNGAKDNLPTYVIGGDNSEFFTKVFLYLGKFRSQISSELLGKIHAYVTKAN